MADVLRRLLSGHRWISQWGAGPFALEAVLSCHRRRDHRLPFSIELHYSHTNTVAPPSDSGSAGFRPPGMDEGHGPGADEQKLRHASDRLFLHLADAGRTRGF